MSAKPSTSSPSMAPVETEETAQHESTSTSQHPQINGTPAVLMSPVPPYGTPSVQISGMPSPVNNRYPHAVMGFDPSQLMILTQQAVGDSSKVPSSPAVTAIDALKLGLVPTTPLMTMSPAAHPAAHPLMASPAPPGTPVYTHADGTPGMADWSQHYFQLAHLQNMTTGFLSPAGQPLSPNPNMLSSGWNPAALAGTPGLVATPLSLRPSPAPLELTTPAKQVDERANSDSRTREASEKASNHGALSGTTQEDTAHLQTPAAMHGGWLNVAGGYGAFPAGPFGHLAHAHIPVLPPNSLVIKNQSDAATAGTASSAKLEDHPSLFTGAHVEYPNGTPPNPRPTAANATTTKPDGRLVDTVLHAKSLTEQMLREFSVEGAADVLRTALSLLGRPHTVEGEGATDAQTTVGEAEIPTSAAANGSLPSVKLVHPDEFKNASTFLKIYGDPLCFTKNGPLPKKGRNGNWECSKCNNVNFPRRFRCNMCSTTRDEEGDRVVSEYARQVYERYIYIYRSQLGQNGVQQIVLDRDSLPQGDQPPPPSSQATAPGSASSSGVLHSSYQQGQTGSQQAVPAVAVAAAQSASRAGNQNNSGYHPSNRGRGYRNNHHHNNHHHRYSRNNQYETEYDQGYHHQHSEAALMNQQYRQGDYGVYY
eukprot:Blabericola_migrator_1__6198@NODE_312_length_10051_cov_151_762220_g255_i0_p4_GENE_NODE_312_length_10051_cov_151_762220_g255_i0NODE_312_length_10051_cov_151_762220_g255_i0_p4_ORF_typecomplete_len650_score70_81zfRanBP/PF00641_18/1_7e08_NODE_312_length_10051_cov_151_762220_g255_i073579306